MFLFALFDLIIFSKSDDSIFQTLPLQLHNITVNFNKMTIQFPYYLSISPSFNNQNIKLHNLRSIRSFSSFILSNHFTKFNLKISSCFFSHYLSPVINQDSENSLQLYDKMYDQNSGPELFSLMQTFFNSNSASIDIFNCVFKDIIGNQYNDEFSAALRLFANHNGGSINITDSKFINCRSDSLSIMSKLGGALYIHTSGDQPFFISMNNLIFSQCNSYDGAAFSIKSECPVNYTQLICHNINVTNCINLPTSDYFDRPINVVNVQNCYIKHFSNILFEDINNDFFLMNILVFSNCDGKISSLQFSNIKCACLNGFKYQIIEVNQNDGFSHTLIFDGLGFQNIKDAVPILLKSDNNVLNCYIENFYYPNSNYMYVIGSVSTSVSIDYKETSGLNIITPTLIDTPTQSASETPSYSVTKSPTNTPTESPTESLSESPTETPTETPIESPTETPIESPTETPIESPTETPIESPTETPIESPTETPSQSPTESPTETPIETLTESPTGTPAESPTETPTESPTESLTETPTGSPTESPTESLTETPTGSLTESPTETPIETPTELQAETSIELFSTFQMDYFSESHSQSDTETLSDSSFESLIESSSDSSKIDDVYSSDSSESATESPSKSSPNQNLIESKTKSEIKLEPTPKTKSDSDIYSYIFYTSGYNLSDNNDTIFPEDFNPDNNERSVSKRSNMGIIVGCTIGGVILIVGVILLSLFLFSKKTRFLDCCHKTAFQPSEDDSKTELYFYDGNMNQVQ